MAEIALVKICSRCKLEKPISSFGLQSRNADGLRSACSGCERAASRKKWQDLPREERLQLSRLQRSQRNAANLSAWRKEYKAKNKPWRLGAIRKRMRDGETFCAIVKTCKWSAAYVRPEPKKRAYKKRPTKPPVYGSSKWQATAPPDELEAFLAEKPWRKAGLSEAESYKVRYHSDTAFNAKEKIRLRLKKKMRGERFASCLRRAVNSRGRSMTTGRVLRRTQGRLRANLRNRWTCLC